MAEAVSGLVAAVSRRLADAGVDAPLADAHTLVSHAAGMEPSELRRQIALGSALTDAAFPPDLMRRLEPLVAARAARIPLQHVTGLAHFGALTLAVGPGVFVPRPETETLAQLAVDAARDAGPSPVVVDLCAGSGAIGLSVAAAVPGVRVILVEREAAAFAYLERNALDAEASVGAVPAAGGKVGTRIVPLLADATDPTLLAELACTVDVLASNPPYVPPSEAPTQPEAQADPASALYGGGDDGMEVPLAIIGAAARLLREGGVFLMEHSPSQADAVLAAVAGSGAFVDAAIHDDLAGRHRLVRAVRAPR